MQVENCELSRANMDSAEHALVLQSGGPGTGPA